MKTIYKIIKYLTAFALFFSLSWFSYDHVITFLNVDGLKIVSTSLSENFILRIRFALLSGIAGAVIYMGVSVPDKYNKIIRFLIMVMPAAVSSLTVLFLRKSSLTNALKSNLMDGGLYVTTGTLKTDSIPLAGLVTASVFLLFLLINGKRKAGNGKMIRNKN